MWEAAGKPKHPPANLRQTEVVSLARKPRYHRGSNIPSRNIHLK